MSSTSPRPPTARKTSDTRGKVPGGFDDDDELFPAELTAPGSDYEVDNDTAVDERELSLPPLPEDGSSLLHARPSEDANHNEWDSGMFNERDMRRNLMDIESSFIPARSPILQDNESKLEQTSGTKPGPQHSTTLRDRVSKTIHHEEEDDAATQRDVQSSPGSPPTPPEDYQTPFAARQQSQRRGRPAAASSDRYDPNTSSLETMSSSPTAAAAARTVSRVVSMATIGGYETAEDRSPERPFHEGDMNGDSEGEVTPRKTKGRPPLESSMRPPPTLRSSFPRQTSTQGAGDEDADIVPTESGKRPSFLKSRHASQLSSTSSYSAASNTTQENGSNATLGADFALQSGGAAPADIPTSSLESGLSRSISLGSIASGISAIGEGGNWGQGRTFSGTSTVQDHVDASAEDSSSRRDEGRALRAQKDVNVNAGKQRDVLPVETPKAPKQTTTAPSDTVIAQHIRNIHVPASVARQYRQENRPPSPDKKAEMNAPKHGPGKGLALKEQISTIDRLHNQNWDLKLKIHFLDQALKRQSEEGVKEMISENVELKAGLATLEKQSRNLRKRNRELERKVKEHEEGLANAKTTLGSDDDGSRQSAGLGTPQDMEEEITYLRNTVKTYEVETERMRNESLIKEGEKRHLAEIVRTFGDRKIADPDVGVREEIDVWKELLASETAHKDHALEQINQLKEENWRLRGEASSTTANHHTTGSLDIRKSRHLSSARSRSRGSDITNELNRPFSAASSTLVDHLRHENDGLRHETEELRRVNGAQTAMLTSRLRERDRLCQELEDLKIAQMRGDGAHSVTGDSILERSASRAFERSASRNSGGTKVTAISDNERDEYENNVGQLRDQVAEIKLRNHDLEASLERHVIEMEQLDVVKRELDLSCKRYEEEMDELTHDLQTMQGERDEALQRAHVVETEFDDLKDEAQTAVDGLGEQLQRKDDKLQTLEKEIANRDENFSALQSEMRSMSEGIVRLEDDQEVNLRKMNDLRQEIESGNRELEALEDSLREANGKVERLTVQQESSQGEINFLREEQDGDKIKIGDLESALKKAELSISEEKDRAKELEGRLVGERRQRDILGSKEKQEVQKIVNDLNREASSSKDEARRLKKNLSSREVEATEWKERLIELENNLREALGDLSGTRSSLLKSVTKLQKELDATVVELDITKINLTEKENLLRDRDLLLENTGLESRKLSDLIDKERQARKAERHHFEQVQKGSEQTMRTLSQHEARVVELESARQSDRKKLASLDAQYKEQLTERNNLLLTLWNRLSALCGTDWAHRNSLVSGRLPSIEVVSSLLPGFGKNLLSAVKTIEVLIGGFKSRIRGVEKGLWKEYQVLEHNLDIRMKRLDRLETLVHSDRKATASSSSLSSSEVIAKLRGENRLLKAEIGVLQKPSSTSVGGGGQGGGGPQTSSSTSSRPTRPELHKATTGGNTSVVKNDDNRRCVSLTRHHSTSAVESIDRLNPNISNSNSNSTTNANAAGVTVRTSGGGSGSGIDPSDERWIARLRELEKRLKAEREARLTDRSGARKRLEEGRMENEELRLELEREKVRKGE
ncbi:MAG: Anucleate primary sterigmata protein B [Sclerophora amabilis]|nr:MAG: Anucleate primary sterigmata protein B [Sclerophora amabilis]